VQLVLEDDQEDVDLLDYQEAEEMMEPLDPLESVGSQENKVNLEKSVHQEMQEGKDPTEHQDPREQVVMPVPQEKLVHLDQLDVQGLLERKEKLAQPVNKDQ